MKEVNATDDALDALPDPNAEIPGMTGTEKSDMFRRLKQMVVLEGGKRPLKGERIWFPNSVPWQARITDKGGREK